VQRRGGKKLLLTEATTEECSTASLEEALSHPHASFILVGNRPAAFMTKAIANVTRSF